MSVNGIEIKAGQRWVTRSGDVVQVQECQSGGGSYPFRAVPDDDADYAVAATGEIVIGKQSEYDLVRPAVEPKAPWRSKADEKAAAVLVARGWSFNGESWTDGRGYATLASVLERAYSQASGGKGKERHAVGETPFEEQPMATINRQLGSVHGFVFQAHKKSLEAMRLPAGRDVAELLGAINYLAGAVIALESWAKKAE